MRIYYLDTSQISDKNNLWTVYMSIKNAEVIIVPNEDRQITQSSALAIFYAMKLRLPIVFYNAPDFATGTFPFFKELILRRLNKLLIANINILDSEDTLKLLTNLAPINYMLTIREATLGYSYILSQLRKEIASTRTSDLSPYPELATPSLSQPLSS